MKVGEFFQFSFYQNWIEICLFQAYFKMDMQNQIPCLATLKQNICQIK